MYSTSENFDKENEQWIYFCFCIINLCRHKVCASALSESAERPASRLRASDIREYALTKQEEHRFGVGIEPSPRSRQPGVGQPSTTLRRAFVGDVSQHR